MAERVVTRNRQGYDRLHGAWHLDNWMIPIIIACALYSVLYNFDHRFVTASRDERTAIVGVGSRCAIGNHIVLQWDSWGGETAREWDSVPYNRVRNDYRYSCDWPPGCGGC